MHRIDLLRRCVRTRTQHRPLADLLLLLLDALDAFKNLDLLEAGVLEIDFLPLVVARTSLFRAQR